MNPKIKEMIEDYGIVIDPSDMVASWKEIEFLCESLIMECASVCEANSTKTGKELAEIVLQRFDIELS